MWALLARLAPLDHKARRVPLAPWVLLAQLRTLLDQRVQSARKDSRVPQVQLDPRAIRAIRALIRRLPAPLALLAPAAPKV